jgi:lysophospholipase L1-like esterase
MQIPQSIVRWSNMFTVPLIFLLAATGHAQTLSPAPANILVHDGQKVAFMGDSITGMGWEVPGGFVKLVVSGLDVLGVKIVPIPAGVGGNTSQSMLARLEKDVLSQKPDWLLLNCGVNDVWGRQVDLDTFKKNITSIVDQAQAAGIKVMILSPTPIYEAWVTEFSKKEVDYVAFMRQIAQERNLPLADLNAAYFTYLKTQPPDPHNRVITVDGVHPNPDGHLIIAQTILEAFGVNSDQMVQIKAAWMAIPDNANVSGNFAFHDNVPVSIGQYETLKKIAAERKTTVNALIKDVFMESIRDALVAHGELANVHEDNIAAEAQPIFKQKIEALVK